MGRFGSMPSVWPTGGGRRRAVPRPRNNALPQLGEAKLGVKQMMMRSILIAAASLALATGASGGEMRFYQLPAGSYPHDVAPAPDGTVWFSGQQQGFAGRFDPETGKLEKISLGNGAAPHGVIVGPDGKAWLTEGGQNAIARVDAKTREVKLFPLPAAFPGANLNTLVFGKNGIVWFTGQSGVY